MPIEHYTARARLRELMQQHPNWRHRQFAEATGYSVSWVRKWRKRLEKVPLSDEVVLWGYSCRPKNTPHKISQTVIDKILEIRDERPGNIRRIYGPKTILYYLHQDESLKNEILPTSTRTVWKVLDEYGYIERPQPIEHEPVDLPEPGVSWQMDFKSNSSVPPQEDGKQQHVVETLNFIDEGTSIWLDAQVHGAFTMEQAIIGLVRVFEMHGRPDVLTFDRDPRFVGSQSSRDFPSPFIQFLLCLDVEPFVCPPRRPDLNGFVERLHRTYKYEYLIPYWPETIGEVEVVAQKALHHYNHIRPHQGRACGNMPPHVAFPDPLRRPRIPRMVAPDKWLDHIHKRRYIRQVRASGSVSIDTRSYYVKKSLAGQRVAIEVDANTKEFVVHHERQAIKRMAIKGIQDEYKMPFWAYFNLICKEASKRRWQARR